jgi:hypothetical protein
VTFTLGEDAANETAIPKVLAFAKAGHETTQLLGEGCPREELRQRASAASRAKLWDGWCGYLGPQSSRGGRAKPGGSVWGMR